MPLTPSWHPSPALHCGSNEVVKLASSSSVTTLLGTMLGRPSRAAPSPSSAPSKKTGDGQWRSGAVIGISRKRCAHRRRFVLEAHARAVSTIRRAKGSEGGELRGPYFSWLSLIVCSSPQLRFINSTSSQLSSTSRPATARSEPSPPPLSKRPRSSLGPDTLPSSTHSKHDSKTKYSAHARPRHSFPPISFRPPSFARLLLPPPLHRHPCSSPLSPPSSLLFTPLSRPRHQSSTPRGSRTLLSSSPFSHWRSRRGRASWRMPRWRCCRSICSRRKLGRREREDERSSIEVWVMTARRGRVDRGGETTGAGS